MAGQVVCREAGAADSLVCALPGRLLQLASFFSHLLIRVWTAFSMLLVPCLLNQENASRVPWALLVGQPCSWRSPELLAPKPQWLLNYIPNSAQILGLSERVCFLTPCATTTLTPVLLPKQIASSTVCAVMHF